MIKYYLSRLGRTIYYKLFRVGRKHYLTHLINKHRLKTFVEVGVWDGKTSHYILKHCRSIKKVYCIDHYAYSKEMRQKDIMTKLMKENTLKKLNHYKVKWMLEDDKISVNKFKDGSMDCVFLDHAHTYDRMKEAIKLWLPKVKKGGYLTGHQYELNHLGCVQAVQEVLGRVDKRPDDVWVYKKK